MMICRPLKLPDPDIDQKQESPDRPYWNVGYSQSVRVNIGVRLLLWLY